MNRPERPWSKHLPDGPFDCIVIGSGMGGMTAAALLADLGRRVLVLEQHYVPGVHAHIPSAGLGADHRLPRGRGAAAAAAGLIARGLALAPLLR